MELTVVDDVVLPASDVRTDRATKPHAHLGHHFRAAPGGGPAASSRCDVPIVCCGWKVDTNVLVQQSRRADVVRTVWTLVGVLRLWTVVGLV